MKSNYDVIIIGAGIGGMTAAAVLAKNGKKVLVLEQNPVPGGCAVNFKRGDYEFDSCIHLINSLDSNEIIPYSFLEICGIKNKILLLRPEYLYRSLFPGIDIRVPQCNQKGYMEELTKYFPEEKSNIERLFNEISELFLRLENMGGSTISTSKLISYLDMTTKDVLDAFLVNEKLKAVIAQLWPYYGLPPSKLSALYYFYPWYDFISMGGYYPAGGGKAISASLKEVLEQNGGKIQLNSKVVNILVENDSVCGVEDERGDRYKADIVISNIDIRTTFHDLIDKKHIADDVLDEIDGMEPSISAFVVYLGLNLDFNKINNIDHTIFVNPNFNADMQYDYFLKNDFLNAPFSLSFYSNLPVDYAPPGKSVMSIMTLAKYDYWKSLDKNAYREQKKYCAELLIKRAEEIVPRLSSHIEVAEAATPLTMERYTGNYNGAIYGWSQIVAQSGMKRLPPKTSVNNLYLVGAWTQPGGGIKGVMRSGINISEKILKDN